MRPNPYRGINAHLNSWLQTPDSDDQPSIFIAFQSIHTAHIVTELNSKPPNYYIALTDVLEVPERTKVINVREILDQRKLGRIVTRLELLSPSNKANGSHHEAYLARRTEALESSVPLVEIDYLHESPAIIHQLPLYPQHPDATPYMIIVSDPRPNWAQGPVSVYGFSVGETLPIIPLPLAQQETLIFDFNAVYQHTFQAGRWGDLLDYQTEPERFETYSAADQARIHAVMSQAANQP